MIGVELRLRALLVALRVDGLVRLDAGIARFGIAPGLLLLMVRGLEADSVRSGQTDQAGTGDQEPAESVITIPWNG